MTHRPEINDGLEDFDLWEDVNEEERRPLGVALVLFFAVVFYSFLIGCGFIYALVWAGWL